MINRITLIALVSVESYRRSISDNDLLAGSFPSEFGSLSNLLSL